jgi:hypothetical protein
VRHLFRFDKSGCFSASRLPEPGQRLTALFVRVDAARQGLHLSNAGCSLSPVSTEGTLLIEERFIEQCKNRLATNLSHPTIIHRGHRHVVAPFVQSAGIPLLSSIKVVLGWFARNRSLRDVYRSHPRPAPKFASAWKTNRFKALAQIRPTMRERETV